MDFLQVEPERGLHANGREFSSPVSPSNGIGADPQQFGQLSDGDTVVVVLLVHALPL
jgi:hypothetical protein